MSETSSSPSVNNMYPNNTNHHRLESTNYTPISDNKVEEQNQDTNDISTFIKGTASTIQTRDVASQKRRYATLPPTHMPDSMKLDVTPWLRRPYCVGTSTWRTTDNRFSVLTLPLNRLPRDAINANSSLSSLMRGAGLYRMKMCINISCTGTLVHQGMLIAAVVPPLQGSTALYDSDDGYRINTFLSGPHAFISANEASSVCVEVPFYCATDLDILDTTPTSGTSNSTANSSPPSNVANLVVMVLNPLVASTGASTSLTLLYEVVFEELELYVPSPKLATFTTTAPTSFNGEMFSTISTALDSTTSFAKKTSADFIDNIRQTFKNYTGLHNPNNSKLDVKHNMSLRNYINVVDSGTNFEKLDPNSEIDRVVTEPIFNTTIDEMMIKNIISKPQYLGTFKVNTTMNAGALLWSRPISPWQGGCSQGKIIANNIELLYNNTRAWKGDLEVLIQSSCTNKHSVKLKVIKYYFPPTNVNSSYPIMSGVCSAPSDLLEYSGGNQTHSSHLPFVARNNIMYNSRDQSVPALCHGVYYIYLAQPLVIGDSIPTEIEFNVYMRAKDNFQYFGYSTEVGKAIPSNTVTFSDTKLVDNNLIDLNSTTRLDSIKEIFGESAKVMNNPSDQQQLLSSNSNEKEIYSNRIPPLVDIRPLIRRMQCGWVGTVDTDTVGTVNVNVDLSPLLVEAYDSFWRGSVEQIPAMFYGKHAGLKFKLKASPAAKILVTYVPPNIGVLPANSTVNNTLLRTYPDLTFINHFTDYNNNGAFPLPVVEFPVTWQNTPSSTQCEYEFSIPNASLYKYIGGPTKMGKTVVSNELAVGDLGYIVINTTGPPNTKVDLALYYAYTDESRLGFQVIAPIIRRLTQGTNNNLVTPFRNFLSTATPSVTPNKFLYYSTLSTTYS